MKADGGRRWLTGVTKMQSVGAVQVMCQNAERAARPVRPRRMVLIGVTSGSVREGGRVGW